MLTHTYRCPLRWSDMDAYGHVNNVTFLRYLEEARVDMLFRFAPGEGQVAFSEGSVVARHEVDYLRPLVHRHEPVTIEMWLTSLNAASFTLAYEVKDGETVYVRAATRIVPYVLAEGRPRRLSTEERDFLRQYLAPADGSGTAGGMREREGVGDAGTDVPETGGTQPGTGTPDAGSGQNGERNRSEAAA